MVACLDFSSQVIVAACPAKIIFFFSSRAAVTGEWSYSDLTT